MHVNSGRSARTKPLRVAVAGKGGVAKTTIRPALMLCLSEHRLRGLAVVAVDADPTAFAGDLPGRISARYGGRGYSAAGEVSCPHGLVNGRSE